MACRPPAAFAQQNAQEVNITVTAGEQFTRTVASFDEPTAEPTSSFVASIA